MSTKITTEDVEALFSPPMVTPEKPRKKERGPTPERLAVEQDVADALAGPLKRIGRNIRKRLRGNEE